MNPDPVPPWELAEIRIVAFCGEQLELWTTEGLDALYYAAGSVRSAIELEWEKRGDPGPH